MSLVLLCVVENAFVSLYGGAKCGCLCQRPSVSVCECVCVCVSFCDHMWMCVRKTWVCMCACCVILCFCEHVCELESGDNRG